MAIEWNGTEMYHLSNDEDRLFIVDRSTAALTPVGVSVDFGIDERGPQAMAWDGETMFFTGTTLDALLSLDLVTGAGTRIGTADDYDVNERLAKGLAWQVEFAPPAAIVPPEPQFDGFEEFTEEYDIKRITGDETFVVSDDHEMLIESGVDSRFFSIGDFSLQESLGVHTLTPRFSIADILVGDIIGLSAGGLTYTVVGFIGVGSAYRQQIVVSR